MDAAPTFVSCNMKNYEELLLQMMTSSKRDTKMARVWVIFKSALKTNANVIRRHVLKLFKVM